MHAILDANTGPETFLVPTTAGSFNQVTFRLLEEGAGFENLFGWYNVGQPDKRFPVILSCAYGSKTTYEPPVSTGGVLSGGYQVTVNFQAEFAAGRYAGKQIGFYLISPEGSPNRNAGGYVNNCATDPVDQGTLTSGGPINDDSFSEGNPDADANGFGRLYYTESQLNNDGNYVHYLIYQSSKNSQHFYFGFEDLFRGGDNDYDDTLVKVEGLVPTCQPKQEICNGVDDNCNTQVDENLTQPCSTACGTGTAQCSFSNDGNPNNDWVNCTALKPTSEVCNGLDDDCNGTADDNLPPGGACPVSGCVGNWICSGGKLVCNAPSPATETCDGKDNDCNGLIDDGLSRSCSSACGSGTEVCQFSNDGNPNNDWINCTAPLPKTEICNGLDDDCNGTPDDAVPPGGACVLSGCSGTLKCLGGKMQCDAPSPTAEVCDGKDNDCNNKIDDGVSRPCSTACGLGTETCQFIDDSNPNNDWVNCTAPLPKTEICNGLDDDCDGAIDNNLTATPCTIGGCGGTYNCVGGKLQCDAPSPSSEICDGKDNDCNGQIDENLIRSCFTACGFGAETCQFTDDGDDTNDWIGCTAPLPQAEVCDGVDNDCNGVVDDNVPGEGQPCDHPTGTTCKQGQTQCVGGKMVCIGATETTPEICDCKDNDCDTLVDEDDPCPTGTKCIKCGCRIKCTGDEFGCPKGFACVEGFCIPDECAGVTCKEGEKCVGGTCVSLCAGVNCPDGQSCVGGSCVDNSCYGKGCNAGEVCVQGTCQPHPCAKVQCAAGEYCSDGECKPSCGVVSCGSSSRCVDGKCLDDPCAAVTCAPPSICVDGTCDSSCDKIQCPKGQRCRVGVCEDDPCQVVRCYRPDERCEDGQCISGITFIGERSELLATGSGGFACAMGQDAGHPSAVWLLLLLGLVLRWRRRGVGLLTLLVVAGLTAGCQQDPYQMINLGDFRPGDSYTPDSYACSVTNGSVEICDGVDNDCNGVADDPFNLQTSVEHCGTCDNSCLIKGAVTICELGQCKFIECAPGFIDMNKDPKDGCEYDCVATGAELCDGLDNDCNGKIDETFDLDVDVLNCGACTNACQLANAVPKCEGGVCKIQQCQGGYIDKDKQDPNGCEEPCVLTNNGVEICDGKDNDCNGVVDDPGGVPVDFQSDKLNCGACGVVCGLPNASVACQGAICVLVSCSGTHVDADKNPVNGCECLPAGIEICDGKDNDCNGTVDDGLINLGSCGSAVGECTPGVLQCLNGLATCVGAVGPKPEECNGKDDDCNSVPDDNLPAQGICGSDVGQCKPGTYVCSLGTKICTGDQGPQSEVCDGLDNDCNGTPDDNLPALGSCGSSVGECQPGSNSCQAGVVVCVGAVGPTPEVCDGKDNDCNNVKDDNLPGLGICGSSVGECKQGTYVCVGGVKVCSGHTTPKAETCNGKDDDCNGQVDDSLAGYPGTCGSSVGECVAGTLVCQAGVPTCLGQTLPAPEMCDGKDTDCDSQLDPLGCVFPGTGRERRLDQPTLTTLGAYNSTQLHVAGSGQRVLAVWVDRRRPAGQTQYSDIYGNLSLDGGKTWHSNDIGIVTTDVTKIEPHAAFGGPASATQHRAYVAYERFASGNQRDVYLRRSLTDGLTWGSELAIETTTKDALFVRVAVHPGANSSTPDRVVVCWETIYTTGAVRPNILCALSTNSGQSFGPAGQVNLTPDGAVVPRVAMDASYIHVTWQQGDKVKVARSAHVSPPVFSTNVNLSPQPGLSPQIATDGSGTVLVVWEDVRDPLTNIRANRSLNSGQTWLADGVRVDKDVVNGDSTQPSIAMRPGGRVFAAWADSSRGQPDVYTNFSDDGGLTWGVVASRVNAELPVGSATSSRPMVAVAPGGSNVYVAWEDYRNGLRDIYASVSLNNGATWNIPDYRINESTPAGAADTRLPFIWASTSRVAVVWVDNRLLSSGVITTGPNADIYASYLE